MNNKISPEDMASFEVLHTQNHSGSFSPDDFSYLAEVTVPVPNGDINHHTNDNFDLTNMHSALAEAMHDSSVEVRSQLLDVIGENSSLQDKLNKSNSIMKEQMTTISAWRDHMIFFRDQQEKCLQQARTKISFLEEIVAKQQEQIKNMKGKGNIQSCMKCSNFESTLNNMLAIDSAEENESLFLELGFFRENLLQNLQTICHHTEILSNSKLNEEERRLLKTFVLILKFKIAALEAGNLRATVMTDEETGYEVVHQKPPRENVLQLHQDIEDLKVALRRKDNEVDYLKKGNEELLEKIKSHELLLQDWESKLKSQFEMMNNKLEIETSVSEKYKERCENLQQQVEEYEVKLDKTKMSDGQAVSNLHEEIQNLQDILKLEQRANQNDKEKLSEVMLKCENLQVDYDRVTKLLEVQTKDEKEKSKELASLREKDAKENIEKVDQLTAQLFEMEEQMRETMAEVRKLQEELAEAKEQEEAIPILKAQVELYKTDFQNVESARDAARDEVERLTNEIKKFERCDGCSSDRSETSTPRGHRSGRISSEQKSTEVVECPFCGETFRNESIAQRHIHRIHDLDNP